MDVMDEDSLTLQLSRDMRLFVRRQAKVAARDRELVASAEPQLSAEYIERLLYARRGESWRRGLRLLQAADWLGSEIFAATDVGTRHRLDSQEAEHEIHSLWTHIPQRRWRKRVAQWIQRPEIGAALMDLALEFDSEDPACKDACLAVYDRPTLWMRLRGQSPSTYAKLKRIGTDSFIAVRLG